MPIIFFNCHEVGHIVARCPMKKNRDEKYGDKYKSRRDDEKNNYKDKGKKSCYIAKKYSDSESSKFDKVEVVYVAMKDDSDDDDTTTLISYVNKNDKCIIDSGFSHHMTSDRSKFSNFETYDVNNVKFGNVAPFLLREKGPLY